MQKWEYMRVGVTKTDKGIKEFEDNHDGLNPKQYLNLLGSQGWELVNATTTVYETTDGFSVRILLTTDYNYFFKRPIE